MNQEEGARDCEGLRVGRVILQLEASQIYQPRRTAKYLHTFQVITGCISKKLRSFAR